MSKQLACPTCGKMHEWSKENPWRPFCCERCKLIDLGAWAAEEHRIKGEPVLLDPEDPSCHRDS